MLLQNGAERTRNFVDLKDDEQNFLASVGVRKEKASGDLFLCSICLSRNFDNILGTAPDLGHDRRL